MRRVTRRGRATALLATLCLLAFAGPARGHIVYAGPTLHQLVFGADVVARARIVSVDTASLLDSTAPGRPSVVAELLEAWKGGLPPGPLRFVQHGHGVATFEAGEEVVVFLRAIQRSRELSALAESDRFDWVSLQEHDDEWALSAASRDVVGAAVRRYVALEGESQPQRRAAGLRRLTLELLRSDEPRLAASALRDLVRSNSAPLVAREDLPQLTPLLEDARAPVGLRAGLLAELERRGLLQGDGHWVRLLETARIADRPAAIRAAGAHPSPAVTARLVQLLAAGDAASAEAAAMALGAPGNRAAIEPLSSALAQGDARLRMAAIRGLGRIALPESRRVLESAAQSHADVATRRRAAAELRVAQGS
jgi:hypothetical protein